MTEDSPRSTPRPLKMNPIVKGLRPRPPYGIDVANTSGIRTEQHWSTNARNP